MTHKQPKTLLFYLLYALSSWRVVALLYAANFVICTLGFMHIEQHGIINAVWWSTVTWFTVGYGDLLPLTDRGKLFTIYAIVSSHVLIILLTANFISRLSMVRNSRYKRHGIASDDDAADVAAIIS